MSEGMPNRLVGSDFGWYRIDALIGRGGMGDVYRAYDTKRDREVALKVLAMRGGDDGTFAERFRRECQVVARLGEPHVIPIHDYGEIDGTLFLDMRLVDGGTLRDLTRSGGALAPTRAIHIAEQVAAALGAAHQAGVVHRDVKPENILLTGADFAYLVDFGIAVAEDAASDRLTRTGTAVGSTAYMAPEQFEGTAITPATDIYSLTTVLYEMLAGRAAHTGGSVSEILRSVLVGPVAPASSVNPALPPAVDSVLERGMSQRPADRYRTAAEMVSEVRAALGSTSVSGEAIPAVVGPTTTIASSRSAPPSTGSTTAPPADSGPRRSPAYAATQFGSTRPGASDVGAAPFAGGVVSPNAVTATPTSSGPKSASAGPLLIGAGLLVVGALVAAIVVLLLRDGADGNDEMVAATSNEQAQESTVETQTETTTLVETPSVYRSAPGQYGVGLTTYKSCAAGPAVAVFTGYPTTSCGFATNVAAQLAGLDPSRGPRTVSAYSNDAPGIHQMSCGQAQDGNSQVLWRCQGGRSGNAVVYVYP